MPAISVGSVEVDVLPNARGIEGRLRAALVPSATQIGDEVGRIIGQRLAAHIAPAVRDGINNGGRAARPAAARQGDETAGAFSRSLKARLEAAFRSLPKADVTLSTTGFDADMARLRARLETLSGKRIGIDIDAGAALAEITDIEARLRRLGAEHPNVQVRADTAAALAQLAALRAEVDAVDGKNVDVDTSAAAANFRLLTTAALAFGPAIIPVLPVVAAGLGAVAAAGAAAAAGIGSVALVAVPAFKQIGAVLQAQKAAQTAATAATVRGSQANSQGASKALQMAGAQQALATAERNGARQIAQAQQQVVQAKRAAADAVIQAAQRNQQAARQVQDAERSLADAQVAAKRAQEDLTEARKQAALELEDLNNRLVDSQLSQRDAEIALTEATAARDAVLKSATATDLQKQKALLAYDEAVQRLKEQTTETKRLKSETAKANKAGVEGSATVKSAQDKVAQAQRAVADQARAVKDAQVEAARTQVETARQVAEAQQKVSDATANVAVAQQNAADAVASAQRQIASASQQAAGGVDQAAIAQAKYQAALAKLTPSARDTLNAFLGLRTAFGAWSRSLQPAVMPIFTRALVSLRNTLPTLTPFVRGAVTAIKELQDRVSASVKTPFWQGFKTDLQADVTPAVVGLGVAFGNIFKGMAGIIDAFLPHMDGISSRMQVITGRFAAWGAGLKGSPEFERFLTFAAEKAPLLGDTLGKIATAFLNVGEALAPISGPLLSLLGGVAEAIGIVADKAPWMIQLIYGIIVATKLWTIAQWALDAAAAANPWTLVIVGLIALTAVVIYAYNRFGWFRTGVQAVWAAIQVAALAAWNSVLKPTFSAIVTGVQWLGSIFSWLWTTVLRPVFSVISLAVRILITAVLTILIVPLVLAFKLVAAIALWLWKLAIRPAFNGIAWVATWLWTHAIKPAFEGIAWLARWLYNNAIKPVGNAIKLALRGVGDFAKWLWQKALAPAFHGIADVSHWLYDKAVRPVFHAIGTVIGGVWEKGIKPVFSVLKTAIGKVADAFKSARDTIKTAWDKLKAIAKAPVQYVVDVVYNNGIRGVWNKIAGAFGAPKLSKFSFASGGIMPGYTPGRDVHRFVSPTGGQLELSGGEAIMRPEFTRAVGSGFVGAMNSIAKSRGAQGVKAALAPVFGGNPHTPTDTTLRYKDGGIFGWIGSAASAVKGAGSDAWNGIKKGASWLADTLEASARAGVKKVVNPLLARFPGMDTGIGKLIRHIPDKILDALFGYSKDADKKGGGGLGGPRIQAALKWARTQDGKKYQWAGNGNPSWDCSGFMSAIESVIRGQKPHRRWATGAFHGKTAPPGWVLHGNSPFRIGITNAGVGHTAGTLGKTNVESRGGAGVIVGRGARGYKDSLFSSWYGFKPGSYDSGGYLQPGMNLAYNGTGRPEPVFTTAQADALSSLAARSAQQQLGDLSVAVYVGNEQITDIARAEVRTAQGELIQVLNAS